MLKNNRQLILDTHVWIWLFNSDENLKKSKAFTYIEKAVEYNKLAISIISVWELAMLEAKGRISFTVDIFEWLDMALKAPGISLLQITPEIAVSSTRLPGNFHGDPADRLIVATARKYEAYLVTKDRKIIDYGKENHMKIIPV